MKRRNIILLTLFAFGLLYSCEKDDNELDNRFESYRYELWIKLIDNDYQFDFVGTQTDYGNYPEYSGNIFDIDHEGISGIESEGVFNNLNNVLSSIQTPDIVLLGIGVNDLFGGGDSPSEPISNINQIIDALQVNNPNITVFLEQILPARNDIMTTELTNKIESYNSQIVTLASNQTDSNSTIISIDMNTDFLNRYFADELHYNEQGAFYVSDKYFTAIQARFNTTNSLKILTLGDSRVVGNRP